MNLDAIEDDAIFEAAEALALAAVETPSLVEQYLMFTREALVRERAAWKRKPDMTQLDRILTHMEKAGSITQREALLDYSIQSLTRRIADLRELGYDVISERRTHPTTGQSYTRYFLGNKH